jgi:hypothetical protein
VARSEPFRLALVGRLARIWRERVDGPRRKAIIALLVAAIFGLAHLARLGTPAARWTTALLLLGFFGGVLAQSIVRRRGYRDPRWVVSSTLVRTNPQLGHRTLRAMRLVDRALADPTVGSSELAHAHLERTLSRIPTGEVRAHAAKVAEWLQRLALAAGVVALGAVIYGPFRVIEGLDVLVARKGVAPLSFQWIEERALIAHPPDYLHQRDVIPEDLIEVEVPYGSLITLRGVPLHAGRRLVLVDGKNEVPFVDDAAGGVVARWPLTGSTRLRTAARFGGVLVFDPYPIEVRSIPDEAPIVRVEGAPKTVKLLDVPFIEVSYEASDDHGLKEVHLVLRSGAREERRMLARLDGEATRDRGGYRLWAGDRFFKRSFAPMEIVVEARDNDPLRGPKWGKSAAITVIPPIVGEPEALRYEALEGARNALVDLASFRIENGIGKQPKAHASREVEETNRTLTILEDALDSTFGGLKIARRTRTLAEGQIRKLRELRDRELKRPTKEAHAANRKLAEDFALAVDSLLRRLDATDAASIAKRLSDVAEDAAEGAAEARRPTEKEHGLSRLEAALGVLDGGGGELLRLGMLGRDLGEIVGNDLKRARRARGGGDLYHAELSLRDLAARLRHPAPSFSGGRGGVESGGGGASSDGDPSDVGQQIAREQEQIEELSRDHGAEVAGVEQAMSGAESGDQLDQLREEAKEHARAARDAVRALPRSGGEPGSAESEAAAAREQAEAMADALESGAVANAVRSGRHALEALDQAERSRPDRFRFRRDTREDAREAEGKLEPEVRWAERALARLRQAASEHAAEDLKKTSPRESQLADRAKAIAEEGKNGAGALPGETLDLLQRAESAMREAARDLGAVEGDRALERLKEAQRLLEMARSEEQGEESESGQDGERSGHNQGQNGGMAQSAPIPKAEDYKGPEAFRRRVLEGLGNAADPRLKDAVKRYAERLLR